MKKFEITLLGRTHMIDYEFEAHKMAENINKINADIVKPHILSLGGSYMLTIDGIDGDPFFQMIEACKIAGAPDGFDFAEYLMSVSDEDVEWTAWRNRDLTGTYYRKITFHRDFAQVIIDECDRALEELNAKLSHAIDDENKEIQAAEAEKQRIFSGMEWKIDEKTVEDEGGKTAEYIYTINLNGKKYIMTDRNVFDLGRVVNYNDGTLCIRDGVYCVKHLTDDGWKPSQMTADEQRVAEAVMKYGKYAGHAIRM